MWEDILLDTLQVCQVKSSLVPSLLCQYNPTMPERSLDRGGQEEKISDFPGHLTAADDILLLDGFYHGRTELQAEYC